MTRVLILSENTVVNSIGVLGEHGFSVWLEHHGQSYLFDTGQTGICVSNAREMKAPLRQISALILSHGHYDHCNGLETVLDHLEKPMDIYAHPDIFGAKYTVRKDGSKMFIGMKYRREYLETRFRARFCLHESLTQVGPGVWMSGTVPRTNDFEKIPASLQVMRHGTLEPDELMDDNTLFVETQKGLVVILGCAHRGMINILEFAKKSLNLPIRAVIGGTHLMEASENQYEQVCQRLESYELDFLSPGHCTGSEKIRALENRFGKKIKPAFCGRLFEFH